MATVKKAKKKKRKVLSQEERITRRRQIRLHSDIKAFFKAIGFEYINTQDKEKEFGGIKGELDGVYIYDNIIVLCEETLSNSHDHLRTKHDYFERILENKSELLAWLKKLGDNKFKKFDDHLINRYKIFYVYASESNVDEDTRNSYSEFKYLGPRTLKYFLKVARTIRFSTRSEFFKYLGLTLEDIGNPSSSSAAKNIDAAVIVPESSSGFPEGVHVVSFVMKAQELLDCAYVFRRDNWESQLGQYYQRLMDKPKIEKIRAHLAKEGRTFIDNIIVSLPEGTAFSKIDNKKRTDIDISSFASISNVQISIPYKINSIGIIDGQHRVYGHYEGSDVHERKIKALREKRHLFVSGIFYDENKFDDLKKRTFESSLFLQMNSTHKKVNTDLIQFIETLKSPLSPVGVAGNVLMRLNKKSPFLDLFQLSPLDKGGIRTPTIIKYGLQSVVEINQEKETLFKYWKNTHKSSLHGSKPSKAYEAYISFCADALSVYFSAVKCNNKAAWNLDKDNRLLSSTAIVAFLRSFSASLKKYKGVKDFEFYNGKLKQLNQSFSKAGFAKYGSSHWRGLSEKIDKECWT